MTGTARVPKILLIDSNVYFSKRLGDALKKEGFQVLASTQPEFALTTLEYDIPTAVVCATNMRGMGALEIATIIKADPKNANLPIIALGDGSQRALMEAFQAGCDDYIDRQRQPAVIAAHIRNIITSKSEGFQPTQMLAQADTSLSGNLTHHDLPGVLQMLGHARQTGALHINAGATDAVLFFDAGNIAHAECGSLFGDEAVIHIVKSCIHGGEGVYKFVYGATTPRTTVLRSATDLMLDAMREYDESAMDSRQESEPPKSAFDGLLEASAPVNDTPQQTSEEQPAVDHAPDFHSEAEVETAPGASLIAPEPPTEFAAVIETISEEHPFMAIESENLDAHTESPASEASLSGSSLSEIASPEFQAEHSEQASVTGYTETSPELNEGYSENAIVLAPGEEVSLLETILTELAARHIEEEQHPADLADKEAQ
jgi:CheY-like chemotaxis protein